MHRSHRRHAALFAAATMVALLIMPPPLLGLAHVNAAAPRLPRSASAPRALASSPKPDWRGTDLSNAGLVNATGPAVAPAPTFSAAIGSQYTTAGIEIGSDGSIVFTTNNGTVYAYAANGTKKWSYNTGSTLGNDISGSPSNPALSSDGNWYIGDDAGNIHRINASTGAGSAIFNINSYSGGNAGVVQTPKIGADNTLYLGGQDGYVYHLDTSGNMLWSNPFFATGSKQVSGPYAGKTSRPPFYFYGELAQDGSADTFVASTDTNPAPGGSQHPLGTLYKLDPTGALLWKDPLLGAVSGAVVYAQNPVTPTQPLVIVADQGPEVAAFDASTGAPVWSYQPSPASMGPFLAGPAVDMTRGIVYVEDSSFGLLLALNEANGQPLATVQASVSGTRSSPIIDSAGNVFVADSQGNLSSYTLALAKQNWIIQTGAGSTQYMSPAIDGNSTIYVAGNRGAVYGFSKPAVPATNTPTNTPIPPTYTPTNTPTRGPTATPTHTSVPTATFTPGGPSLTPTSTPSNTPTSTSTSTPIPPNSTSTPTSIPTATSVPGTPAATATSVPLAPGPNWSKFRYDLHNDGDSGVHLTFNGAPLGQVFSDQIGLSAHNAALYTSPAVGPVGADGTYTVYQVDDTGHLVAIRSSDGSKLWTSSNSVLGTNQPVPVNSGQPQPYAQDFGSSPAVATDGTVYAGSENGGIWRFSPNDPTHTGQLYYQADPSDASANYKDQYFGGSVVIGPDGTIYAGAMNGWVYAVNPGGQSLKYKAHASCPRANLTALIQSTPALDRQGNLYIGFGCSGEAGINGLHGGIMKVTPSGAVAWTYFSKLAADPTGKSYAGEVAGAVTLSPNESAVYAIDTSNQVYALSTANGSVIPGWGQPVFLTGLSAASPALSPDGSLLYLYYPGAGTGTSTSIYALNTANGAIAFQTQTDANQFNASPAVDAAGDVIVGESDGHVIGYSADLSNVLFDSILGDGHIAWGGPTIGPDGTIYIADGAGYVTALKSTAPPPTNTPVPTNTTQPYPTVVQPATFTPVPTIAVYTPTPVGQGGGATATPVATATQTGGQGGGGPSPTPISSGHGSGGGGRHTTGHGFRLSFNTGHAVFARGATIQVQVQTTPQARVSYTVRVDFVYPAPKKNGHSTKKTSTKKTTRKGKPAKPHSTPPLALPDAHLGPRSVASPGAMPATAHIQVHVAATMHAGKKGKSHPGKKGKPPVKHVTAHPACAGPVSMTVRDRGTFRFSHSADRHGLDQFCLRIATAPARAIALRVSFTVEVTSGKHHFKPGAAGPFLVQRATPHVSRPHGKGKKGPGKPAKSAHPTKHKKTTGHH